ncbi:endonuclease domain-containing protein [Microbacterium halimionae]|uniref:endonuclease domain-containing protein n=1 Tax=Microbacterium halimionae TaxID=1526413 RepID=UPI003132BD40|nr:very-short-patch-repair endonuclease [Microbacterium halimionae]
MLEEPEYHVAAAPHARGGTRPGAHVHWAQPVVPRHPDHLVDGVENMLAIVSLCQPFEPALAVWESALRVGLITKTALEALPFQARAREILSIASPYSDSGLESFVMPRLKWMRVRIVPQAWILGHRVDFLIGARLILQIDGAHHVGDQRTSDNAHNALLMINGFHVVRIGYAQVVGDWPSVQDIIMRAVAQGLHLAK